MWDLLFDHVVGISFDMALKIPSLRSCHLASTELGEWVMYILRALRFDMILVYSAFYGYIVFYILVCYF